MELSLVVVNWNSGGALRRLLASALDLSGAETEAIVVDNDSHDESCSGLTPLPNLRVLRQGRNLGFSGAANLGIAESTSELVLLLNPDITLRAETVRRLQDAALRNPRAAIVCGGLVSPDGESQRAFQIRRLPTFRSVLMDVLFLDELKQWLAGAPCAGSSGRVEKDRDAIRVEQPAAAFWLLRRSAWESIGGFDERFQPAWFEDVDFCKRLAPGGWEILYFPQWSVRHEGGASLKVLGYSRFLEVYYGNLLIYWKKHHARTLPLLWLPVKLGLLVRRLKASS